MAVVPCPTWDKVPIDIQQAIDSQFPAAIKLIAHDFPQALDSKDGVTKLYYPENITGIDALRYIVASGALAKALSKPIGPLAAFGIAVATVATAALGAQVFGPLIGGAEAGAATAADTATVGAVETGAGATSGAAITAGETAVDAAASAAVEDVGV